MANYPRDIVGYGPTPPNAAWPNGARVAVQFVLNYEEGAENCILHGDPASRCFVRINGAAAFEGALCRWNRFMNTGHSRSPGPPPAANGWRWRRRVIRDRNEADSHEKPHGYRWISGTNR